MDLRVEVWMLVSAMEMSNGISDSRETDTGILDLLWECLLAEVLGWRKYRTLGVLSSRRDQETQTEVALLVIGAFMFFLYCS